MLTNSQRRLMLQKEIRGLDVELEIKRIHHQVLTEEIERLEASRAELVAQAAGIYHTTLPLED